MNHSGRPDRGFMVEKYQARILTQIRNRASGRRAREKHAKKKTKKKKEKIKMGFMELFVFDVVLISCGLFVFSCFTAIFFWIEARKENREMKKAGIIF